MLVQLLSVFLDVVAPVFAIVALGFALRRRLQLDARTLSRAAYYVFIPAFMFDVVSRAEVPASSAVRMAAYAAGIHLVCAGVAWAIARLLRRSRETTAAFVMLAVFGNTGNYGLALVQFRLGDASLVPGTIYFIAILVTAFSVCVVAAARVRGGGALGAVGAIFRTPALVVVPPALVVAALDLPVPALLSRATGLLGSAMIPVMLLALGLQLAETRALRMTADVVVITVIRLAVAPALAAVLAAPFALGGVARAAGIVQSAMPAAVLVSIIATEHDIVPGFVTSAVFFSTVCSVVTLTVVLALV